MFGFFHRIFDFNHDGKLDTMEQATEFMVMDEMMQEDEDREKCSDAGLDYDILEIMDPEKRREEMEDAGLDPDDFDF